MLILVQTCIGGLGGLRSGSCAELQGLLGRPSFWYVGVYIGVHGIWFICWRRLSLATTEEVSRHFTQFCFSSLKVNIPTPKHSPSGNTRKFPGMLVNISATDLRIQATKLTLPALKSPPCSHSRFASSGCDRGTILFLGLSLRGSKTDTPALYIRSS